MCGLPNARSDLCACFGAGLMRVMHPTVSSADLCNPVSGDAGVSTAAQLLRYFHPCVHTHDHSCTRNHPDHHKITPEMSCHYVKLYCEQTRV